MQWKQILLFLHSDNKAGLVCASVVLCLDEILFGSQISAFNHLVRLNSWKWWECSCNVVIVQVLWPFVLIETLKKQELHAVWQEYYLKNHLFFVLILLGSKTDHPPPPALSLHPHPTCTILFLWVYCIIISSIHHPPLYVEQEVPMCGAAEINHLQSIRIHLFCLSLNEFEDKSVENLPLTLLPARKNIDKSSPVRTLCCQDVVWTQRTAVGRLDLVSRGPRLGRLEGPRREGVPQISGPACGSAHRTLLPGHQAAVWEVSYLRLAQLTVHHLDSRSVFLMSAFFHQVSFPPPRLVATPLASLLGVRDKRRVCAAPNPVLEVYFCSTSKHPTQVSLPLILGNQQGHINAACPLEMTQQTPWSQSSELLMYEMSWTV